LRRCGGEATHDYPHSVPSASIARYLGGLDVHSPRKPGVAEALRDQVSRLQYRDLASGRASILIRRHCLDRHTGVPRAQIACDLSFFFEVRFGRTGVGGAPGGVRPRRGKKLLASSSTQRPTRRKREAVLPGDHATRNRCRGPRLVRGFFLAHHRQELYIIIAVIPSIKKIWDGETLPFLRPLPPFSPRTLPRALGAGAPPLPCL